MVSSRKSIVEVMQKYTKKLLLIKDTEYSIMYKKLGGTSWIKVDDTAKTLIDLQIGSGTIFIFVT
jgi:hypothetical protein